MTSSARTIPDSEWDRHKSLIVELYQVNTLKYVRAEMQRQHGFEASSWQYETQLKRWNIRKNVTRKEWQQYFAANDDGPVTAPTDDTARNVSPIVLSKSTASKKRARKWASMGSGHSIIPQASPSNGPRPLARLAPNVPGGLETTMQANVRDTCLNTAIVPGVIANSSSFVDHSLNSVSAADADSTPAWFHNVEQFTQALTLTPTALPTYSSPVVPNLLSPYFGHGSPGRAIFASLGIPAENNMHFFGMLKEPNFRRELPSTQFEHDLESKGIFLDQISASTMLGGFATKFVAGILSSNNQFTGMTQQTPHLQRFLRKLGSQVPGESSNLMITNDQAFETKFARILLFSMLNGFAGLNDIPMKNILRFLNRFVINNLLLDILEHCSQYALRTLADNIFRAVIEAADTNIFALLLSRKLVDVNAALCLYKGKLHTAIERAAALRCPKFVKSLIDAGADAKESAEALINDIKVRLMNEYRSELPPDSYETLNLLVSVGAHIYPQMMIRGRSGQTLELDFLISQNIHPERHKEFFQNFPGWEGGYGPVTYIAEGIDDSRAANSIQKVIGLCHESNCNNCLTSPGSPLRMAAIDAASMGKLKTVQLLLDKADLRAELPQIFLSAIKSGSRPLIDFILGLGPELDPSAVEKADDPFSITVLTTPIAQAVRYGNMGLRLELEKIGCLDHLSEGDRFEAMVQAAAAAGDVAYMRDLLACAVTSKKSYRESGVALALAIHEGHKDIAHMLLEAGATVNSDRLTNSRDGWNSFVEVLDQEEIRMVHALISSRHPQETIQALLDQADYSIVVDMAYEFPGLTLAPKELESLLPHFIKNNALDVFRDLLQHLVLDNSSLEYCLRMAVEIGHVDMIGYLLGMGANPFSDIVLRDVVTDRPDALPLLLLQTERSQRTMTKCIGTSILIYLMSQGAGNAEALEELIRTGAINFKRLEHPVKLPELWNIKDDYDYSSMFTPLGMALQGVPDRFDPNMATVRKFLKAGADPNGIAKSSLTWTKGSPIMTGLMVAIEKGLEEAVNILLDSGANINARPRIRTTRTALQYAAELGNFDMVRLLVRRGADINSSASSHGGGTAIQFAAISGNCNLVAYLLDHGGQLGALPSRIDGMWPLEGAAANGRLDMIRYLWEMNVRLVAGGTFPDGFLERNCLRAMYFAQENGHCGCRDYISDLAGIAVGRLETDEYGAPWIAY